MSTEPKPRPGPADGQISVHTMVFAEHHGDQPRPGLVIDSANTDLEFDANGVLRDAWIVDMMGRGWQQISHSPDSYPYLSGCTVVLHPDATGRLFDADRSVILPELPPLDDFWLDQAHHCTSVDVIAGHMGLWGNTQDRCSELLHEAIEAGQVIGARVPLLDMLLQNTVSITFHELRPPRTSRPKKLKRR